MENIKKFARKFGGSWVRVKFYKEMPDIGSAAVPTDIRFCEALHKAKTSSVFLTQSSISCLGAKYAFGWDKYAQNRIIQECKEKRNLPEGVVKSMIESVPRLKERLVAIGLNTYELPDILISYLQPGQVMRLIKYHQTRLGKNIHADVSCLMSVCGNIAVRSYLSQQISISFGCDDSRLYGKIPRDRLVVGVPYVLMKTFL
ncbi:DUF169 domain-containing protein [candidate division KSB1 bacterium]|nr:DUF169 domain-containing protein [candidate division KSB1 bacterium]